MGATPCWGTFGLQCNKLKAFERRRLRGAAAATGKLAGQRQSLCAHPPPSRRSSNSIDAVSTTC